MRPLSNSDLLSLFFLRSHFQAGVCPLQVASSALEIFLSITFSKPCFRALPGFLRASCVDLFRTLRGLGQNGYLVGQYFRESPRHRQMMSVFVFPISDLPDSEFGDQRGVSR